MSFKRLACLELHCPDDGLIAARQD